MKAAVTVPWHRAAIAYDPRPKIGVLLRKDRAETPQIKKKKSHSVSPQKAQMIPPEKKKNAYVPYVTANTRHISLIWALCTAVHLLFTILHKGQRKEEMDRRRGRGGERWGGHMLGRLPAISHFITGRKQVLQLHYKSVSHSTEVQRRASFAEIMANV